MHKIKFGLDTIKLISMFESLTHSRVKDCFDLSGQLFFIVESGDIGKAIGKSGSNIRRIESVLKRKIRIIEFNDDLHQFIQNVLYPQKLSNIEEQGNKVILTASDTKSRGMIIGRAAANLRNHEAIVKRYFDIDEIKVN